LNSLTQYDIENNDQQLIDITRRILLQVIGLDKCILQQFKVIRNVLIDLRVDEGKLNVPYNIDPTIFTDYVLHYDPSGDPSDPDFASTFSFIESFKKYKMCLTIQGMLCYALLNVDAVYGLKLILREDNVTKSKSLYGTKDSIDKNIVEESEKLMGMQVIGYELFREIISYIGNFSNKGANGFSDLDQNDLEESNREEKAIRSIFYKEPPNDDILAIIGLEIIQKIYPLLPNSISGILNSAIIFSLSDTLIKLFVRLIQKFGKMFFLFYQTLKIVLEGQALFPRNWPYQALHLEDL